MTVIVCLVKPSMGSPLDKSGLWTIEMNGPAESPFLIEMSNEPVVIAHSVTMKADNQSESQSFRYDIGGISEFFRVRHINDVAFRLNLLFEIVGDIVAVVDLLHPVLRADLRCLVDRICRVAAELRSGVMPSHPWA